MEILCSGQKNDIENIIERIRRLEEPVSITDVSSEYLDDVKHFDAFRMLTGDMGMEMTEGFATGSMYLEKLLHGQNQMLDKQDQTLDQIKIISSDIKTLSGSIIDTMNSRFERLENDMAMIKTKLAIRDSI